MKTAGLLCVFHLQLLIWRMSCAFSKLRTILKVSLNMAAWVKCFATISIPFTHRQRQLLYLLYPSVAELLSSSGKESQKHEIGKTQLSVRQKAQFLAGYHMESCTAFINLDASIVWITCKPFKISLKISLLSFLLTFYSSPCVFIHHSELNSHYHSLNLFYVLCFVISASHQ